MAEQPIDLEAVRRVDTKIDQVLAAYPELQAVNPERLQALEERLQEEYTMTEGLTGKARGRPKTKEYVTMLARVPAELADLVKRYAAQHGQIPVSELIREGLEWRIGDGDPRGTGLYLDEPVGIREREHTSNTEIALSIPGADVLQEVRTLLAQQWEQIQALAQALERQTVPASGGAYSSNTENTPSVPGKRAPKVKADRAMVEARIHQLRDQGLSYGKIAVQLQAEGIPTISGRGVWAKGNVERMAKGES